MTNLTKDNKIVYDEPSEELMEALKEARDIENGKICVKTYNDVKQLKNDLLDDDKNKNSSLE